MMYLSSYSRIHEKGIFELKLSEHLVQGHLASLLFGLWHSTHHSSRAFGEETVHITEARK